jgi:NAD(P)-dependent dehydrogenase (short-subunit alcohol dehydrogenase family)
MGVEIQIAGFPEQYSTMEDGKVVLIEGGEDSLGRFLAHRIAYSHTRNGSTVKIVSSRPIQDVNMDLGHLDSTRNNFDVIEDIRPEKFMEVLSSRSFVIIDRLDYLVNKYGMDNPRSIFEELRNKTRITASNLLLIIARGCMDIDNYNVIKHNVDAIFHIESVESPEGTSRFFRIEKWTDGIPLDKNIFFKYENNRFNIDLRSKVI